MNINLVTAATKKMSAEETIAALATTGLNEAQMTQILMSKGMAQAEAEETAAKLANSAANVTATATTYGLAGATTSLKLALNGVKAAFASNPIGFLITAALTLLTIIPQIVSKIDQAAEEAKQKSHEVAEEFRETQDSLAETKKQLDDIAPRYAKLAKGVDSLNQNVSLSNDEYDEYLGLCNDLGDMFPELIQGFDAEGNAILTVRDNVQELNEAYKQTIKSANDAMLVAGKDTFKAFKDEAKKNINENYDTDYGMTAESLERLKKILAEPVVDFDTIQKYAMTGTTYGVEIAEAFKRAGVKQEAGESGAAFIVRAIKENREIANAIVGDFEGVMADSVKDMEAVAKAYLSNAFLSGDYSNIGTNLQTVIQSAVSGLGYEFYNDLESVDDLYDYLSNLLNSFNNLTEDDRNKIEIAFGAKTKLNNNEITVGEYLSQLSGVQDIISTFDEDTQAQINLLLNDDDFQKKYQQLVGGKDEDFTTWVNGLSNKEIDIVFKIQAQNSPDDTKTWSIEKWKEEIENYKIPDSEKFHFSDLIATEDFKKQVDDYKDKITELDKALKDLRNGDLSEENKIELFEKFPELAGQADNLNDALVNLINNFETDIINDFNNQLDYMDTDDDVASLNNLKNSLLGLATTAHGVENVKDKIDELKTTLSNLKSSYDSIKSVINDYNNNGYLTLDNLQSIMSLEPEYINLLINENGQINLNSQAYKNYVTSKAKSLLVNELKDLYGTVLNMKQEEAQAYANAKAYDEETRSVKDLLTATTQLYIDKARAKDSVNGNTTYMDALTRSFGTAANYAAMVDDYINSLSSTQNEFSNVVDSTTSALDGEKESLEANKKALEDEKNALEDTKKSLEDYKNELSDAQNNLKDFIDLVTDYIKQIKDDEKSALKDQIEALNKQKEALDESKNKYADVIDKKKEALKLAKEEKEAAEELANKQKSVAKDRLALEVAGLDDSSAGKKAQKQAKDNLATSEKDLSNYLSDQSYEKQVAELEDLQKKFEESIEKRKVAIDNQVEYINSKIDEIDKYLDNSRRLYEDACNMIDNDNGTLYANLWNYTYTYTTNTRAEFDYMWSSAQAALEKYRGENNNLIEVMESLQTEIYNTDNQISYLNSQINNLDAYIDNVSRSIDNVSNAISNQSNDVDGLASSWNNATANALAYKRALDDAANNTNTNNNGIPSNAKWTFDYYKNGKKYTAWSTHSNYSDAAEAIIAEIQKNTGQYRPDVYGGMKRYASGTRHTKNPLSLTQEDGLEALFVKNPNGSGSYTLTTPDSQVFDHQRTDELYKFSGNPEEYISKLAKKGFSPLSNSELNDFGLWNSPLDTMKFGESVFDNSVLNRNITNGSKDIYNNDNSANNQNITISMPIQIQGNADSSVVQALNKYKTIFKKEIINELTRIGEKYRR